MVGTAEGTNTTRAVTLYLDTNCVASVKALLSVRDPSISLLQ